MVSMSIDYLHEEMKPYVKQYGFTKGIERETLEIIIIIIKLLQLNVDIRKKKKNPKRINGK